MIYNTFKKRRAVLEYDTAANIPRSTVDALLKQAWEVTPSKNNLMPYTIHVLGPEHQDYKKIVYQLCIGNEGKNDGTDTAMKYEHKLPFYANILSGSYLLVFTLRLEDKPNRYQINAMARGCRFECTREETLPAAYSGSALEVGMFYDVLGGLCVESGIDISAVLCFPRALENWSELPFVNRTPILIVTLGHAKNYVEKNLNNLRPNYNRIVNFIN